MNPNIELNHLKYFYYTVLEGGVSQAAEKLCVQQPVVSKMLKTLEENLGEPLFWKKGRSKSLTDYGQLIFRHCQIVFSEINKITQVTTDTEPSGLLKIGGTEAISNYLYPSLLGDMVDVYPKLNFNIYTGTQKDLMTKISNRKLDFGAFFYVSKLPADLEIYEKKLFEFHLVIKKSKEKDQKTLESFLGSREIDDVETHKFPTLEFHRKKHPRAKISFSSNSLSLHKELVLRGKGISILPSFLVEEEIKKGKLISLYPGKAFKWDLKIVKRKADYLGRVGERFIDQLIK